MREQKELVELLRSMGFVATQSSISRDLRDLGVIRINGYYSMPLRPDKSEGLNQVLDDTYPPWPDDKVLVLTLKVEDQRLLFRRLRD